MGGKNDDGRKVRKNGEESRKMMRKNEKKLWEEKR